MLKKNENYNVVLTRDQLNCLKNIISNYPRQYRKSALIPILHQLQSYCNNWLSVSTMNYAAKLLDISYIEVYEVASFYTMFNFKPVGKHVIEICHTAPCCLIGAIKIKNHLKKILNIKIGETTIDGFFTLKKVECLAACGFGPIIQIGSKYYEKLNIKKVEAILNELKKDYKRSTYC